MLSINIRVTLIWMRKFQARSCLKMTSALCSTKGSERPFDAGPIGCTESPFGPLFFPFGTTFWTLLELTGKLHSGKGLPGRQGGGLGRLTRHQGPYSYTGGSRLV